MSELYSNFGRTYVWYAPSFTVLGQCLRLRFTNPRTLETLDVMVSVWLLYFILSVNSTPKDGLCFTLFILYCFCGRVPWLYKYWPGGFMLFVVLCPGTPEGSTGSGSGFKASQKTVQRLKVSSDRLGEAGNQTCDPWFTRHRFILYSYFSLIYRH